MKKIKFNNVIGNKQLGYPFTFINDEGEEFTFILSPSIYSAEYGFIRKYSFLNRTTGVPMINTALTPSAYFKSAPDMSYFDPVGVLSIARTENAGNTHEIMANLAFAFPLQYKKVNSDGSEEVYYAQNHSLANTVRYDITNLNYGVQSDNNWGKLIETSFSSVTIDEYKKDFFCYSVSTSRDELCEIYDIDWYDTFEDAQLSRAASISYTLASTETPLPPDAKIALTTNYRYGMIPSGISSPVGRLLKYSMIDNEYTIKSASGMYISPTTNNQIKEVVIDEGLPSSIHFVDTVFTLSSAVDGTDGVLFVPIYNEFNTDEFYLAPFKSIYDAELPPIKTGGIANENGRYLKISNLIPYRVIKEDDGKWRMRFSSNTLYYDSTCLTEIGYYEGTGDPYKGPDDGCLELYYVSPTSGVISDAKIKIYPQYYTTSVPASGVFIPYFLTRDSRYRSGSKYSSYVGHFISPDQPLHIMNDYHEDTYVCSDSATYTIVF